jgi:hypothetical protein
MISEATNIDYNSEKYVGVTIASGNMQGSKYKPFLIDNVNFETKFIPSPYFSDNNIQFNEDNKKQEVMLKKILVEREGVIIRDLETDVEIKFEKGVVVIFSKNIFPEEIELGIGTNLNYQVCLNDEGYKYQNFEIYEEIEAKEKNKELLNLISTL